MNTVKDRAPNDPTPEQFAEAAAWIAKLHGPNRTVQIENGLRRWLKTKPEHQAAFESMNAAWEITGRLPKEPLPRFSWRQSSGYSSGFRDGFLRSVAVVAAISLVAVGVLFYDRSTAAITTGIGEQRQLTLEDGSHVYLNTSTRLVVEYDHHVRKIELESGEALFEVARQPERPFIVQVGTQEVRALGTSFVVRRDDLRTEITLVDGRVAVSTDTPEAHAGSNTILNPGERLTVLGPSTERATDAQVDKPAVQQITAWRRGLVDFENTKLSDAIDEMNRYSERKIVLQASGNGTERAELRDMPITGVFRAGDAESFAAAVSRSYELQLKSGGAEIVLQ